VKVVGDELLEGGSVLRHVGFIGGPRVRAFLAVTVSMLCVAIAFLPVATPLRCRARISLIEYH